MGRERSTRVHEVKAELVRRLSDGHLRPGDRFLSNRAVAERFEVSYQTADRLLRELVEEGYLERRSASGTYVPGATSAYRGVSLHFHPRASRLGSFGAQLLAQVTTRLARERIPTVASSGKVPEGWFPVIWEVPGAIEECITFRKHGLILNQRPHSGIAALYLDSVSVDDYSGGVMAAELLAGEGPVAIVAGPEADPRSRARVGGYHSLEPAPVVVAGWFEEDGYRAKLPRGVQRVFCANDRLAQGVLRRYAERGIAPPKLVGFDDAPVAAELGLTTIAIPWAELGKAATDVIVRRMTDQQSTGIHQVVSPRPIVRGPARK